MPDILSIPTISINKIGPPTSIFDTSEGDLTDITGVTPVTVGNETSNQPVWSKCGVGVESDCGCLPSYYPEAFCHYGDHPITNDDEFAELPLSLIFKGGSLEQTAIPKPYIERPSCCKSIFRPLRQHVHLHQNYCETNVDEKARNNLTAYAHIHAAENLISGRKNKNPSLALTARVVNPGGNAAPEKISECAGLNALLDNHMSQHTLVAPMSAINALCRLNQVERDNEGVLRVKTSRTRVLLDPAIRGTVGPPTTVWDGTSPINVSTDLTEADPGCVWMYMAGPIYSSLFLDRDPLPKKNGDTDTMGNTDSAIAELQSISVFDPCDVTAVLIDVNKGIVCG